ncbi:ribulokinase [Edaphobacter flagellatus]|uniref:ribulokinase n=1 Tax=Edaphobacter flagellatus TaxID=1933044 RepID=UPI0021B3B795|nr:ribulokinase [Edaphobacter flagellatus]
MAIVMGADFGTQSVRVTLYDSERGRLGTEVAEYPLHRHANYGAYATQSHFDQMDALTKACRAVLSVAGTDGEYVASIAIDTTGSSVIMVDCDLQPLDEYYLWCDTRASEEAQQITATAHRMGLPHIDWCGGYYSPEWGFAKVLHWMRHASVEKRERFATALENCDMVAATLTGARKPDGLKRSICAMGHKWMWNAALGGLPPDEFFAQVDPLLASMRDQISGSFLTSNEICGSLTHEWAQRLRLKAGIPIPVGALDAHWDAIGAGCREGDIVNVVGTSTCVIAVMRDKHAIPGVSGIVPGSVNPSLTGIEAGIPAVGDMFDAIARRAGTTVGELAGKLQGYRIGQTGLLKLCWDNGDRTVLGNPDVGGITMGWNLQSTPQDELFAAIEATAFQTRIIVERMEESGVPVHRVVNGGGIPQNSPLLNQIYANVLNKPVLVPDGIPTSLGSVIFAMKAAGSFPSIEAAQDALCLPYKVTMPQPEESARAEALYHLYRDVYLAMGLPHAEPKPLGHVLPRLKSIRQSMFCSAPTPSWR